MIPIPKAKEVKRRAADYGFVTLQLGAGLKARFESAAKQLGVSGARLGRTWLNYWLDQFERNGKRGK